MFLNIKTLTENTDINSNRLEKTDKVPLGGIRKPALREMEAELQAKTIIATSKHHVT